MQIAELILNAKPQTEDACDAAGKGMGGVHFIPLMSAAGNNDFQPILSWHPFPQWVRDRLSSFQNLRGDITNSDLELAGSISQHDVLAQ